MCRIIFVFILLLAYTASFAQEKWKYDFIVPDNGNFVQAIHAANNRKDKARRFRIFIRSSNYRIRGEGNMIETVENGKKIEFPSPMTILTAPNTSIIGEEWQNTQVESCPQHEGISITSTLFASHADSTYIQDLELWSNYRNDLNAFANRAVAFNEKRCKGNILKNVSLLSTQNTYYTNSGGTTYLEDCLIQGTVDFICGGGTIYFNRCNIEFVARGNANSRDIICAPATEPGLRFGYVFNDCTISGPQMQDGKYMLGSPWKNEPRAVFLNTVMEIAPHEAAWTDMNGTLPTLLAEYGSMDKFFGCIDTGKRRTEFKNKDGFSVKGHYSPLLTADEADGYMVRNVFSGWNPEDATRQIEPPQLRISGRVITWDDIPEAGCYAICRDRKVLTFTTEPKFVVPTGTYEGACFSVRCANYHGGLGKRSDEVVYSRLKSR
ncbi:MAG: pectinesterase family protein [Bacteroides sp.]|nr:pectinesterase family protein [Roseburia sp.]MCM1346512.1 pectinesterase family protein [Bacteroides sp.]MCM1421064.1 pectinesterase family protein [Bacteroides sp.]